MKKMLLYAIACVALSASAMQAQDVTGIWQGTLHAGRDLRLELKIVKVDTGLKATFYSIDQNGVALPTGPVKVQGGNISMDIPAIGGKYEGKLTADGSAINGTWTQGQPLDLELKKVTEDAAWPIPQPAAALPPMPADADPTFDVATIKPSKPEQQGRAITIQGRQFITINTSLSSLIAFAYDLHPKQLVSAPEWVENDKYDITALPDIAGQPNIKQLKSMVKKLLKDRFKLAFHQEKKELSVYALTVGKTGPNLTKSDGDPNGLPGLGMRALGALTVRNATLENFVHLLQSTVLDRPVVDQTGLAGRFDFTLNWTPDESQFGGLGVKIPTPSDAANAPPGLFTAIPEQLGLKLDATKAPVDVIVIDHVEKASEN